MKLNVKGLVFVGFAAAVFAGAAQADADKIVTSKTYVDAKYDGVGNVSVRDGTAAEGKSGKRVITVATAEAIADGEGGYATGNQVYDYVTSLNMGDTYQPKTGENSGTVVGYSNGTWKTLEGGTDATVAVDANDNTKVKVSANVPLKHVKVNGTELAIADEAVNITVATGDTTTGNIKVNGVNVTPYGLGTAAGASVATGTGVVNGETGLVTGDQVYDYIDGLDTDSYTAGDGINISGHKISADLVGAGNTTVTVGMGTDANGNGIAEGAVQIKSPTFTQNNVAKDPDPTTGIINFTDTQYAVFSTSVDGLVPAADGTGETGMFLKGNGSWANPFPTNPSGNDAACDSSHPCALVYDGTTMSWERIQQ